MSTTTLEARMSLKQQVSTMRVYLQWPIEWPFLLGNASADEGAHRVDFALAAVGGHDHHFSRIDSISIGGA